MKRFTAILLASLLAAGLLSGCKKTVPNGQINIVCTTFPQYDWVRQILGDKADNMNVTLLINNRIDLHSYQPSVEDIAKISTCDLFIYVGGESDEWTDGALKQATNKDMTVINLLEKLGTAAKKEEFKEGMSEEEHGHEGEHEEGEDEEEFDEHVWLSLKNAQVFCSAITGALSSSDPGNADTYKSNLTAYVKKLAALDSQYQAAVNAAPVKTLVFGDRFPFRYLVDDYGLNYHAAFPGCSAETEASFETIVFLAKKTDELKLKNIMVIESSDKSIANTVKNSTAEKNQQIIVMNSMQSVTPNDITNGVTYLSIMESNLNALKEALR